MERQSVEQTHHRGGEPDPESKHPHRDHGEGPVPAQLPAGIPEIAPEIREPSAPLGGARRSPIRRRELDPRGPDIAEPPERLGAGFRLAQAEGFQFIDAHGEVEFELGVDITGCGVGAGECQSEQPADFRKAEHGQASAALRTDRTAAAYRCQTSVSVLSRARPRRVSW